tara:strand:+ start:2290 stop:2922 length:633 start_codon:yes stop_codon:yes gene_type:complete
MPVLHVRLSAGNGTVSGLGVVTNVTGNYTQEPKLTNPSITSETKDLKHNVQIDGGAIHAQSMTLIRSTVTMYCRPVAAGKVGSIPQGVVVHFGEKMAAGTEVRSNNAKFNNCIMIPISADATQLWQTATGWAPKEKSVQTQAHNVRFEAQDIASAFTMEIWDWTHSEKVRLFPSGLEEPVGATAEFDLRGKIEIIDLYFSYDSLADRINY